MNTVDLSAMQKALSLVRAGRLSEATAVIQSTISPASKEIVSGRDAETTWAAHADTQDLVFKPTITDPLQPWQDEIVLDAIQGSVPSSVIESLMPNKRGGLAYRLFVPAQNTPPSQAPLIVMLHGCQQNAKDFAAGSQMDRHAGEQGCFVLYPQQSSHANPGACWNWFKHTHQARERGEPQAIITLITHILATYPIDAKRIYVAGLSAGGAMAAILGEQYPEIFAAVGVHSGLPTGIARSLPDALQSMRGIGLHAPKKPLLVPTIVFHGDADATVSLANARHFADAMAFQSASTAETMTGKEGRAFTREIYRRPDNVVIGEYWCIEGAGHAWSGGSRMGSFADPLGPDASAQMIRFFNETSN